MLNPDLKTTYPNTTISYRMVGERNMSSLCEQYKYLKGGVLFLNRITSHFAVMVVLFPMLIVIVLSLILQFLLRPFGEASFVAQILSGIAIGPSLLSRDTRIRKIIFPPKVVGVINVCETLSMIFMFFTLAARIDKGIIKKSGKLGIVLGFAAFLIPMSVALGLSVIIKDVIHMDERIRDSLSMVATLEATISFHVILAHLTELKLLNSEIGRLALSSSLLGNLISWFAPMFFIFVNEDDKDSLQARSVVLTNVSVVVMVIIIVFAVRPVIFWMMRRTPEGKPLDQGYVVAINIIVLVFAFFGELTGQNSYLGPFILGICMPVTPPMGPLLVDKIQYFVWTAFVPCFVINTGRRVNLFSINFNDFLAVELIIFITGCVKVFAIVIPCLYSKIQFMDALALALVLNCRGLYDVQVFTRAKQRGQITDETFAVMVMTAMFQSAIVMPLIKVVYDSSRRYVAFRKRTIQHCENHAELRILACINESENVPAIINMLEVSNPPESNIAVYVMNLEEYVGRAMPVVIPHSLDRLPSSNRSRIDPIINAFQRFQQKNRAFISVQCFTAVAPYASMHDDICSMAFQKSTSFIIFPFAKTYSHGFKQVARNVLRLAPCTIGILYDRGVLTNFRPIFSLQTTTNVCMLFVGGADDREALALASRMGRRSGVMLTVVRFMAENNPFSELREANYDQDMVTEFRINHIDNKNVKYVEEKVEEGSDTASIMNSMGDNYDLVIVGRRHSDDSPALQGLVEWTEIEELGVIGDLLVSPDFQSKASVLVIQQQVYSLGLEHTDSLAVEKYE